MHDLDVVCFELPFRFGQREMRRLAEAPNAICVLAESNGILTGFSIAHIEGSWCYLVTLDVAPGWRRRGLAIRLVVETESQARAAGAIGMALHVYKGNSGAIRLYEQQGYDRAGMHERFYGHGLDALVYRKKW